MALMGQGAGTTAGKAMMRGLRRSIRDMPESELRTNLTDIRDKLSTALATPHDVPTPEPIPALYDASNDESAIATGN